MNNFNILISSAGRRVSLVRLFKNAYKDLEINGSVFASDMSEDAPALQVADRFFLVPGVNEKNFIDFMVSLCLKHNIRLIIPTIDTELTILSASEDIFASNGVNLLLCPNDINNIFHDKNLSHKFFQDNHINTPYLYDFKKNDSRIGLRFPLILKPAMGHSSIGVSKVNNYDELDFFLNYLDNPVIQEFIEGDEYTVDVLVDLDGVVRCAVPRLRIETRAGEVSKSVTVNDISIIEGCYRLASSIKGAKGCITIQCIKNSEGEIFFIEVNPRFGGGYPLSAEAGANFPKFIIEMFLGLSQKNNMQNSWTNQLLMLRYDEGIFINKNSMKS